MITLRGMTWNHPRGVDPLVAHARQWEQSHGVRIEWEARSLEDFEAFPLDELAAKYDLMVIDHPHVGMAEASDCLLPFDESLRFDTVGRSHQAYFYQGKQWALAIDAAAQVSARRAGSLDAWPTRWDDVIALARTGRVLCPLAPVHALMCFFTLCANAGQPCATEGNQLISRPAGAKVLERLRELAVLLPDVCFDQNPIATFAQMSADDRFAYAPLIYGYVTYARQGSIEFGDIPGIRGSTLGGTGIAVSRRSANVDAAVAVALDLASPTTQRGIYATAGGQPAHRAAWNDDAVNADARNFYRGTIATLDASYLRPRFDGYIEFQSLAGGVVRSCLQGETLPAVAIDLLNVMFAEAQEPE